MITLEQIKSIGDKAFSHHLYEKKILERLQLEVTSKEVNIKSRLVVVAEAEKRIALKEADLVRRETKLLDRQKTLERARTELKKYVNT